MYRFGEPDLGKLQRIISPRRFVELLAYERIAPRGEWRDDMRMARVCATVANSNPFRTGPGVREEDFMPDFNRELEFQPLAEMKAVAQRLTAIKGDEE